MVLMNFRNHRYTQAAFALEELILLVPHNSFFVLQYAETLYTAGEIVQAYKAYLRVLEMCGAGQESDDSNKQGPRTRALWGLKLTASKLLSGKADEAEQVEAIDAMATDLLLNQSYKGSSKGVQVTREAARKVLQ
jgi:hypothetical protein